MGKITSNVQKAPIFIIGNPRSGTTLLRLMLTCHPNISIPPEGDWLVQLYARYRGIPIDQAMARTMIADLLSTPKIEGWQLDQSLLERMLEGILPKDYPSFAGQVYRHYANRNGKIRWGDKNNYHLQYIKEIDEMFPNAVYLHIVRDGRDVVCSYRNLSEIKGQYAPVLSNSVCISAYEWKKNIETIRKGFEGIAKERTFTLRYEDLVKQPAKTLQEVCAFLEEDYDESMLLFAEKNRKYQLEPSAFMEWKALTQETITVNRVERWKKEMFAEDRLIFALIANNVLRFYQYETEATKLKLSSLQIIFYCIVRLIEYYYQKLGNKVRVKLKSFSS